MNREWLIKSAIILTTVAIVAGCAAQKKAYYRSVNTTAAVNSDINKEQDKMNKMPDPVVDGEGAYVDTTPVSLVHPPAWLNRRVVIKGSKLPFSFYVSKILGDTGAMIHFDDSVDKNKQVSMSYTGKINGALDSLASKSDFVYTIDNETNTVTWSGFETKTFDVSFVPGASAYQVGNEGGGNGTNLADGGSTGGSSSDGDVSITYTGVDVTQDSQYSKISGDISVWKDIETTIRDLLSKEGKVTVSQSTTTVTVHDHPENVKAIGEYLRKMNHELSKQVRIQVQVLQVNLNHNFNYGINWNLVRNFGSLNTVSLTSGGATNAGGVGSFQPIAITWTGNQGKWGGSQTVIQALEQQGDVSVVTQPTVTTLNNQVAKISVQTQQTYIASTSTDALNDNSTSSSVNPGVVTFGFNLYLLPKIQKDKVYLAITSTLSDLQNLRTINTSTGQQVDPDSTTTSSADTPQIIQVPTLEEKMFNQRSVIPSGATLVLAGFIKKNEVAGVDKTAGTSLLGGRGSEKITQELVMLITPVIIASGDDY
ncbi:MAG: hypothetical protein CMF50_09545 [Legionellales bacterium]|nr:hypothetical protein [Legionellales bacterium]|tara:strand:- start:1431 stop:3041 length:1611 start_codon:yes stop_codon:yes gene_type:complete